MTPKDIKRRDSWERMRWREVTLWLVFVHGEAYSSDVYDHLVDTGNTPQEQKRNFYYRFKLAIRSLLDDGQLRSEMRFGTNVRRRYYLPGPNWREP